MSTTNITLQVANRIDDNEAVKAILNHLLTSLGGSEKENIKVRYIDYAYFPITGIILDERFCIATESYREIYFGEWRNSGDSDADAKHFYDNAIRLNNAIESRVPLEGGEVGDLLTKGEGGANKWLAGSILDTVRGLEGVRYVESGEPLSVIVFDRGGSDSAIGFSDDEGALLYGTWNSTGDDEADAHDFFYNSATWIHASDLRGIANKADKLKVVELEREVAQLKNSLTQIGTGEVRETAGGGSVIDLPGNVLDAVTDVKIVGKTDVTKSVTTPMRVRSVGANLFDSSKYMIKGDYLGSKRYRYILIKVRPNTTYYFSVKYLNGWDGGNKGWILLNNTGTVTDTYLPIAYNTTTLSDRYNVPIKTRDSGMLFILCHISNTPENIAFVFENTEISISAKKVGNSIPQFTESNMFIKDNLHLESVGDVGDYINKGQLVKKIVNGEVAEEFDITPIHTSGQVVAHPNGSIYFEPIATVAGRYSNKMEVADKTLPLLKLDKISKIDFETGVGTELDISKAVITTNSAFTHPELKNGDIVQFEYYYDESPIYGLNETGYYNSNVVLEDDDKAGDFYRVVNKVKSGVLKQELIKIE